MTKISKNIQLIIASISAILAISAVFLAARWLLRFLFRGVNATVAAAIVAAVATGIASLLAVLLQRQYEERQQNATASRDKKVNLYETFLRSWFHVFGVGEIRTPEQSQEAVTTFLATITAMLAEMISGLQILSSWNGLCYGVSLLPLARSSNNSISSDLRRYSSPSAVTWATKTRASPQEICSDFG
jgi:hypothetical protein